MNFMRGRTFLNKYVIIDEAQNLTPKQMKTLITRAGPGTKIICMGNLAQIDTPYLTEGSSGLTFAVDKFKGWPHSGHITLARGERSRLADFASEVLLRCLSVIDASAAAGQAFKRVSGLRKASLTVPVGPLRCLLMMTSATPGSLESLL
jgi:hypothetical protein